VAEFKAEQSDLPDILDRIPGCKVVVAGDVMLDRFIYGEVSRISPEAPIPVLKIQDEALMPGGAGNVLANLHGLEVEAVMVAVIGTDRAGEDIRALMQAKGLATDGLVEAAGRPTTVKTRFIASRQQLLRADAEDTDAIDAATASRLIEQATAAIKGAGALILSDYGKGALPPPVIAELIRLARAEGIPVLVDPKGRDYSIYRGASIVTPNRAELALATGGSPTSSDADIVAAASRLIETSGIGAIVATRSQDGMSIVDGNHQPVHLRTEALEVFDVSGAGDTVIATVAAALAAGASLVQAAAIANAAGGIVVGKIGTAAIRRSELRDALIHRESDIRQARDGRTAILDRARQARIVRMEEAEELVRKWKARGLRVGVTNGCFDILHPGHVRYLNDARDRCDRLVVGLNADESVRRLKGPTRPVNDESARADVLAALGSVDMVVIFGMDKDEDDKAVRLVEALRPDVYFKGGDYREDQVPEARTVRAQGGDVAMLTLYDGHSTTATIGRMKSGA
jgi:D-beta-D-heptose 7-phosphate kinase/D-beta-D-heptose 1-phosphate adenosyltransferase